MAKSTQKRTRNSHKLDGKGVPKGNTLKKEAMIQAMIASLGVVTTACEQVGVSRKTYYQWLNNDEDFAQRVEELKDRSLDFVESKLFELINGIKQIRYVEGQDGSKGKEIVYRRAPCVTSAIFYLKTQGKKRGYVEKMDLEIPKGSIVINEHRS